MLIFPAIDLYEGKAVRLYQGDYDRETVYSRDPRKVAEGFLAAGASHLHIVDLDGAGMDFEEIDRRLEPVRESMNMTIHMQRMDIFDAMHRI